MQIMRHELKYLCTKKNIDSIKTELGFIMKTDSNQDENGYTIRSLYFDTYLDRFYYENLNGVNKRNKYRLRKYNNDNRTIKLEKKISINNLKTKIVQNIKIDSFNKIVNNNYYGFNEKLIQELGILNKIEGLAPRLMVEYDRFAYVNKYGNIRITFDENIRYNDNCNLFLDDDLLMTPIFRNNIHMIEVKYDDDVFIDNIFTILNRYDLYKMSFSKYSICYDTFLNNGQIGGIF